MKPIDTNQRIDVLDYLRGFALLGIILVNIPPLLGGIQSPEKHSTDSGYQIFLYLFVEGRFYTIFSFLFGVGFYLFLTRAIKKGERAVLLFLRRILVLLCFGLIHVQFHPGEALTVYAICGVFILPFYSVPKRINLALSILLLAVFSVLAMKIFMTIPVMLLGICAGQYHVFEKIENTARSVAVFTFVMLLGAAAGLIFQIMHIPPDFGAGGGYETRRFIDIGIMIGPVVSAFYAGVFVMALRFSFVKRLLLPLKYYGRMALTNYILQTVFILIAGDIFGHSSHIGYFETFYICLLIYAIQLTYSNIWMHYFKFGPLEWILRMATYGTLPPIK